MKSRIIVLALSVSVLLNVFMAWRLIGGTPDLGDLHQRLLDAEWDLATVIEVRPPSSSALLSPLFSLHRAHTLLQATVRGGRRDLAKHETALWQAIRPLEQIVLDTHPLTPDEFASIEAALAAVRRAARSVKGT